jgi:hypothetical protein
MDLQTNKITNRIYYYRGRRNRIKIKHQITVHDAKGMFEDL